MDLRERRAATRETTSRHPWERARLGIVSRLLDAAGVWTPAVVADIGCGDGFVVGELARRFPAAAFAAVDPHLDDTTLAWLGRRLDGHRVAVCRSLEEAAALGTADVILLLDVIEHVEDDVAFLAALRRSPLVGPGTRLVVTVPAHQRLFGPHDAFLHHFRRYDPPVLTERLEAGGFHVQQAGEFFLGPLVLRQLQVWAFPGQRSAEGQAGVAGWSGGRALTDLLTRLLLLDFSWSAALQRSGLRVPGLSAYALCRPSAS
ncbi:MAG: class I SAM-dependent methyltransferase [Vicinamibacterales bacterium]